MILAEKIIILVAGVAGFALALVLSTIVILLLRRVPGVPQGVLFPAAPRGLLFGKIGDFLVIVGRVLLCLLLLAILSVVTGPLAPLWWLVAMFVMAEGSRKYRASRQYALLWLLTVSAERSMPLAPAVAAFARERGGRFFGRFFGRRASQLAELLNRGVSLPEALKRVGGLMPPYALSMIHVGDESGALAPALRRAATNYNLNEPIWMSLIGKITYLVLVPVFGMMVLAFIMLRVVPSFQKIFQDFGLRLPPLTRTLISMTHGSMNFLLAPLFLLLGLTLLAYAMMRYWGWIEWDMPGVSRLVRRLHSAQILDSLAIVARQQRPLTDGIAALAESYPKRDIRLRLGQTEADIRAGQNWCESLQQHDLIQMADLAILQAAQRVGNLPWALQEMADSSRRRLAYRVQALVQMVFPLLVVLLGLVVMFVVAALFLPLIPLIQRLAV